MKKIGEEEDKEGNNEQARKQDNKMCGSDRRFRQ